MDLVHYHVTIWVVAVLLYTILYRCISIDVMDRNVMKFVIIVLNVKPFWEVLDQESFE